MELGGTEAPKQIQQQRQSAEWVLNGLLAVLMIGLALVRDQRPFLPDAPVVQIALNWGGLLVMLLAVSGWSEERSAARVGDRRFPTTGLRRFVRHPMYIGLMMRAVAECLRLGSLGGVLITCCIALILALKARVKEQRMLLLYVDYATYAARVPRFFPRLG